jgi:hypothetical protein
MMVKRKASLALISLSFRMDPSQWSRKCNTNPKIKYQFHANANEQSGYVLGGKYRIKFSEYDQEINPGFILYTSKC